MDIVLVGTGGYGLYYVKELLHPRNPDVRWVGVVDPYFQNCSRKAEIEAADIPVFDTLEEFYRAHTADLALIVTPPFLHREQSLLALSHGSYVLCEKPIAPTLAEAEEMRLAEQTHGKFIAIGYQWSYSRAIQALKRDILDGVLGKPLSMKTAISWPRNRAYYARGGGWGGRIQKDGITILDSIASNACAHYLHNMFFLLGDAMEQSAYGTDLDAECFRANAIENFDTCVIRAKAKGVPLYFIASHATAKKRNPEFCYVFENATVTYSQDEGSRITAIFQNGTTKNYGDPFADSFIKLWDCVDAIRNGTKPICTVETAMPHTALIEQLYQEVPIREFPKTATHLNPETDSVEVDGLFEALYVAYEKEFLLSEALGGNFV